MKKFPAYIIAGALVGLGADYIYTHISNSIKDSLNQKLRHARNSGWSEGFDQGYDAAQMVLLPYIDHEHYRHMHGHTYMDNLKNE